MSRVLILLNKWANYFGLLSLSVRQEFDKMRITYFLPNHCWIRYRLGIILSWVILHCYLSWP